MVDQKRVILGVTGSIAAYKAADIIRGLIDNGCRVTVVMTEEAQQFISPLTLESLSGEKVFGAMFGIESVGSPMSHIDLAEAADVLLIAPATANIIAKLACGMGDHLLTCLALATKAPIIIAPAMNANMYQNAIVQENCRKLKSHGVIFVDPIKGRLACGVMGEGHLACEDAILKAVSRVLK